MAEKLSENVRKLIAHKMAADAIPAGGGIADGVAYLTQPGLGTRAAEAAQWVKRAIQIIRAAPDSAFESDDEATDLARQELDTTIAALGLPPTAHSTTVSAPASDAETLTS